MKEKMSIVNFADGVEKEKFLTTLGLFDQVRARKMIHLLESYGFDLSVFPGNFVKILTANEKEEAEIAKTLDKIAELKLTGLFNANLKVCLFKNDRVVERIRICMQNGLPYTTETGELVPALYDEDAFTNYSVMARPVVDYSANEQVNVMMNNKESLLDSLNDEAKQVYFEVMDRIKGTLMEQPNNELLQKAVSNLEYSLIEPIKTETYMWSSYQDMVVSNMFDNLDGYSKEEKEEVEKLIMSSVASLDEDREGNLQL